MAASTELRFPVAAAGCDVSALSLRPPRARFLYVLAHGAGAGMRHPSLERIATALADRDVATLRYQFPYMEQRRSRVDAPDIAAATVRAAVEAAGREAEGGGLPLIAGGKSFGGRMTSTAQSREPLPGVRGLAFLGFPLHPPGQPGTKRAEHLAAVQIPMLFLQGDRDEFADLSLLRPVVRDLRNRATLHVVKGGDHSFAVLKKSGRTPAEVLEELADTIADWGAVQCATGS